MAGDDRIVCRCEEVTQGEIRQAVHDGMFTMAEIRRYLRCGMGLCQGQTCAKLVSGIVARELGMKPGDLKPASSRAPMRPLEMSIWADERQAPGDSFAGKEQDMPESAKAEGRTESGAADAAKKAEGGAGDEKC